MLTNGFLALCSLLFVPAALAQVSCASLDPVTGACVSTASTTSASKGASKSTAGAASGGGMILLPARPTAPGEASAPPGQYGALGGMPEASGKYLCGAYDEKTKRCLLRESSAEEREHALQVGLESGIEGLRVQQHINLRIRAMGLYGPATPTATMPIQNNPASSDASQPAASEQAAIAACFNKKIREMGKRMPLDSELKQVLSSCQ